MLSTVYKSSLMVIGIACRTFNGPTGAAQDIPQLWQRFYAEDVASQIPNKASDEVIALYCDYAGDYTQPYSCIIGCPVHSLDAIPEGMVGKVIAASCFAHFRAVGEFPKSLIDTWIQIWNGDLKRTYTADYEVYGPRFAASPKEVDVWVAIDDAPSK